MPFGLQDWAAGSAYIRVAPYKTIVIAIIIIAIVVAAIIAISIVLIHAVSNISRIICIQRRRRRRRRWHWPMALALAQSHAQAEGSGIITIITIITIIITIITIIVSYFQGSMCVDGVDRFPLPRCLLLICSGVDVRSWFCSFPATKCLVCVC